MVNVPQPPWPRGFVVSGKWTIERFLGAGGMGAVFEARHRNGKRVALKVLHRHLQSDPRFKAHFLREGYLANRVEHVDVVSVLDDGETAEGDVYLIMEVLQGETLEARRKRIAFSPGEALRIADCILDVLARAHTKGVVHRDIKPANVFLTSAGAVKLLDFGIASLRERALLNEPATLPSVHALGTPSFMAPEQARGRKDLVDGRADIWSLGAVLFTLLSGRFVHETDSAQEALVAAATRPARLLGSLVPHLPEIVTDVVDRALAFDVGERWSDAETMQKAVRRAAHALDVPYGEIALVSSVSNFEQATEQSGKDGTATPFEALAPRRPHLRRVIVLGATIFVGLSALGARWMTTSQSSGPLAQPELSSSFASSVSAIEGTIPAEKPPPRFEVRPSTQLVNTAPIESLPTFVAGREPSRRQRTSAAPATPARDAASSATPAPELPATQSTAADDSWLDRQK
jgi:serine/threonine protein kinase